MNGLDIHLLSKQLGTSTNYIDTTYSHIQVETNTERITQGMTLLKTLEEEWRISIFSQKKSSNKSLSLYSSETVITWQTVKKWIY